METAPEFAFTSEMPRKKTRLGLIDSIRKFWKDTDGGAIPIALAAKILKQNPVTVHRWVEKGKLRSFRYGKQVLVNIDDVERLLDEPVDKGGRPPKAVSE